MRLPTDTTLLLGEGADPTLEAVWRDERLPIMAIGADPSGLEAKLEAAETATVVACGAGAVAAAGLAASLGFRTFLLNAPPSGGDVRAVSLAETLEAARGARARERWKAARSPGVQAPPA
jgi:hypothetical protein